MNLTIFLRYNSAQSTLRWTMETIELNKFNKKQKLNDKNNNNNNLKVHKKKETNNM